MNLTQFIKRVDTTLKDLSREEMQVFIHNIARSLPEMNREGFLEKLGVSGENTSKDLENEIVDKADILKRLSQAWEDLSMIEEGQLCIEGSLNEEYDEWYSSADEEFVFEDPDNLSEILSDICNLIHQCVDSELYEECAKLAERLLVLEIEVEGDYNEFCSTPLTFWDFVSVHLSDIDYQRLILDTLIAAYWSNPLESRPAALFEIFYNGKCSDITLETLIQSSSKEPEDLKEFLQLWIEYLGNHRGKLAETLLDEAITLQNDSEAALGTARKFSDSHPELFVRLLEIDRNNSDAQAMLHIGMEALHAIRPQCVIRSSAALLTAEYALKMNRIDDAELCWLEAFRSDTRPTNYLRLAVESRENARYREDARLAYTDCYGLSLNKKGNSYNTDGSSENIIDKNTYYALSFFDGDFKGVVEKGMSVNESLGWSSTFMKTGIALFMLYLYEGESMPVGCRRMCTMVVNSIGFTSKDYSRGLTHLVNEDNVSLFWECFCKWKPMMPMSQSDVQWIMEKLDVWIRKRVEGIMQKNHRNYYGECAGFIAAFGEVRESRGEMFGKERLMAAYKAEYSRRTAFHQELRVVGMKDSRRR